MKNTCRGIAILHVVLIGLFYSTSAQAICIINSAGISITPVTGSTGTYTPPFAPSAQATTFTVSGTYSTIFGAGTCRVAIAFNRASLPATMARSGSGDTMPYTITSAPSGGSSLLYTGGGTPATGNLLIHSFASAGANLSNIPFTANLTAYFEAQPGSPQRAGFYSDGPTVDIFSLIGFGFVIRVASQPFAVNGTVNSACTISGVAMPGADSAVIPVSGGGIVNTATISKSYANVECNAQTDLLLQSLNGAVKRAAPATGGFTNLINYSASASFGGTTSTLNTATIPTASGAESGSTGTTGSTTPTGTLSVNITPQTPGQPLAGGSYADVLRITLTPQ